MGSVKDIEVIEKPSGARMGRGRFHFSDRYSVFDWGEMPDLIEGKGKALCMIGAHFFEALQSMSINNHYLGVVDADGLAKRLHELDAPSQIMEVRLVRVIEPDVSGGSYDYSVYGGEKGNMLIPLEVIYRNSLPAGSSVFGRLERGELSVEELGLGSLPEPGEALDEPILDVSTKLESTDRYIGWQEAREIAVLSHGELEMMMKATLEIDRLISRTVAPLGLSNQDGKVEFGFDEDRRLMLLDVLGTPDECRFEYEGMPVSKEIARAFYRGTEWSVEVEAAKRENRLEWKSLVGSPPPQLPARMRELIALLYQSCCDGICGRAFFDAPPLSEILQELKGYI